MRGGYTGKDYLLSFMLLNLGYSRRCEKQFRSRNEVVQISKRPRDHSVVDFRNILVLLLTQIVRQLFESLVVAKTSHLIIPSYYLQDVRELGQLF